MGFAFFPIYHPSGESISENGKKCTLPNVFGHNDDGTPVTDKNYQDHNGQLLQSLGLMGTYLCIDDLMNAIGLKLIPIMMIRWNLQKN